MNKKNSCRIIKIKIEKDEKQKSFMINKSNKFIFYNWAFLFYSDIRLHECLLWVHAIYSYIHIDLSIKKLFNPYGNEWIYNIKTYIHMIYAWYTRGWNAHICAYMYKSWIKIANERADNGTTTIINTRTFCGYKKLSEFNFIETMVAAEAAAWAARKKEHNNINRKWKNNCEEKQTFKQHQCVDILPTRLSLSLWFDFLAPEMK